MSREWATTALPLADGGNRLEEGAVAQVGYTAFDGRTPQYMS